MSLPLDPDRVLGLLARARQDDLAYYLASIVESSGDAILTVNLEGIITTWNTGAERLYGYTAEEAIGKPTTMLVPLNRHNEEPVILERIKRGEHVEHYETIRQRKHGHLIDVSLTVSPVKNAQGNIIGASKISRDISERKRSEERQQFLIRELEHRARNWEREVALGVTRSSRRPARAPLRPSRRWLISTRLMSCLRYGARATSLHQIADALNVRCNTTLSVAGSGTRRRCGTCSGDHRELFIQKAEARSMELVKLR